MKSLWVWIPLLKISLLFCLSLLHIVSIFFTPFNRPKSIKEDLTCVLKPGADLEGLRVLRLTVCSFFSLFNFKQH